MRAIIEVHTDDGVLGLGEIYADETHLARLEAVAAELPGHDPYDLHGIRRLVADVLAKGDGGAGASFGGAVREQVPFSGYLFYKWAVGRQPVGCACGVGRPVDHPLRLRVAGAVLGEHPETFGLRPQLDALQNVEAYLDAGDATAIEEAWAMQRKT